ncbi:MAG: hypothetical protein ACLQVD_01985, partial [Capsulimonadaceae bacterium]
RFSASVWLRLCRTMIQIVRIVEGGDEIDPRMNSWAAVENVLQTKDGSSGERINLNTHNPITVGAGTVKAYLDHGKAGRVIAEFSTGTDSERLPMQYQALGAARRGTKSPLVFRTSGHMAHVEYLSAGFVANAEHPSQSGCFYVSSRPSPRRGRTYLAYQRFTHPEP